MFRTSLPVPALTLLQAVIHHRRGQQLQHREVQGLQESTQRLKLGMEEHNGLLWILAKQCGCSPRLTRRSYAPRYDGST